MNNFTITSYGFMITVKESSTFESKSSTFDARDVRSISRNWSDLVIRFNNGSKKSFDAFPASKAQRFEEDLERAIQISLNSSTYYSRPTVVIEERHYSHSHSHDTDAAVAAGAAVGILIAAGIDAVANRNKRKTLR